MNAKSIQSFPGNFEAYWRLRRERHEQQVKAWEAQQDYIEKQEEYIRRVHYGQLHKQAASRQKAIGIWQLTPATARLYGLKVNKKIDERTKVEKETDAALDLLEHLHQRFGCWYLAAAAYDAGENRIARLMKKRFGREKGRDRDYYRIWDDLPGETRDYVPAIIALKRIGKQPAKYGF